ncbi:MAG: tail fiber protein [Candidatus Cybelea sp.]
MKRQTFVLTGAGAVLAGCAGSAMVPDSLVDSSMHRVISGTASSNTQLLGSLLLTPYDFVPRYFEKCAGQILPIASNPALFTLLGSRFGGDGNKTFGLPDMRGHEPIKGLSYLIATAGIYPSRKAVETPNQYGIAPLLGQLLLVAYLSKYTPPAGWATCDGQLQKIDREAALYTLLGTKFGGDGKTTFALPDLRGHEPMKGITYLISLQGRFPTAT